MELSLHFTTRDTSQDLHELLIARQPMDRRRLEEAFLLLRSIEVIQKYNLASIPSLPCDRNVMAEIVTKEFSEAFATKWGGKCNLTTT